MNITSRLSRFFRTKFLASGGTWQSFVSSFTAGKVPANRRELLDEFKNILYPAITAIAEDVANYEPIFKKGERQLEEHALMRLLDDPNPLQTKPEFLELHQIYMLLTGESFWVFPEVGEMTGKPKKVYLARPDLVEVVLTEDMLDVAGYILHKSDGERMPLEPREVMHYKSANPANPYRGLGATEAGIVYIKTEDSSARFQFNFLENQATPSGVLTLQGKIKKETWKKLKKDWREKYAGADNAGKVLFLKNMESDFRKIGLSLEDLDLDSLSGNTRKKVLSMLRVPELILGESNATGITKANTKAIVEMYALKTIDPKLEKLDYGLKKILRDLYNETGIQVSHVSQVPEDEETQLNEWDKGVDRWITRNEIRIEQGKEPIDGGDVLYNSFNQLPLSESENQTTDKGIKVKIRKIKKKSLDLSPLFASSRKLQKRAEKEYENNLLKLVEAQKKDVIALLPGIIGGDKKLQKQSVTYTVGGIILVFSSEELRTLLVPVLVNLIEAIGIETVALLADPDVNFLIDQATRDAIFESTERLMKGFNRQTAERIQKAIADGLANGEGLSAMTKRIEDIYSIHNPNKKMGYRARRIANSEAHINRNAGIGEGYRQSGFKKGTWKHNPPSCEFCVAMHGTTVILGEPFVSRGDTIHGADGGEFLNDYDDIKWAHAHPGCDCDLLPEK